MHTTTGIVVTDYEGEGEDFTLVAIRELVMDMVDKVCSLRDYSHTLQCHHTLYRLNKRA